MMNKYLTTSLMLLMSCWSSSGWLIRKAQHTGFLPSSYKYETKYFEQVIDHFSFNSNTTYKQRYLINTEHWKEGNPIFFYCGNEGDITWFCNNTGFMWDIAPDYNAMLVFAEHRYYGESLPFGNDSYKNLSYLAYLTSEQALADFVVLIRELRKQHGQIPVIAFGGSYGGMLAAWLRMKYPSAVIGSIAASAPIWQFSGLCNCETAFEIISDLISKYSHNCYLNVRNSWPAIYDVAKEAGGLLWLTKAFSLCKPLKDDSSQLQEWLQNVWFNLAEVNYPYPAKFLQTLPAWPVKTICEKLSRPSADNHKTLEALADAMKIYYNYTGESPCLDLQTEATPSLGVKGWNFQACTEMLMPICADNHNDIFPKQPWNLDDVINDCKKQYSVTPRPYWIETQYGGKNITGITNIVFSNGFYDPWRGGGVTRSLSESLVSVVISDGAHHVDMRAANPADTEDIKHARRIERENIEKWLKEY